MRGPPVVLTNTLGRPVTNVISERGAVPMTVVNTLGEPVTLVASGGEPVTLFNANGTLWDYPFSLFSNNEQGAWYDPSDFSTLFQNSTGTTPVTAVEQPVGLMLDKSRMAGKSAAQFIADQPTIAHTSASGSPDGSGVYTLTASQSSRFSFPLASLTNGRWYEIEIEVLTRSGATSSDLCDTTSAPITTTGTIKYLARRDTYDSTFRFVDVATGIASAMTFRAPVLREIPGAHALAPNDASRPVLRARYNRVLHSENLLTGWNVLAGATITSATTLTVTTTFGSGFESNTAIAFPAGTTVTGSALLSGSGVVQLVILDVSGAFAGTAVNVTLTATPTRHSVTRTLADANCVLRVVNNSGAAVTGLSATQMQVLTAADQSSTGGAYQRIAAATDYDTSNPVWRPYLAFDGTDDFFNLASAINITTDMTVVRGFGRSAAGIRSVGIGAAAANTPQDLRYDLGNNRTISLGSTELAIAADTATGYFVATSARNASAQYLRQNGAAVATGTPSAAADSFNSLGNRNGNYNNGPIYGLIVVARELTGSELTATEQWMAGKTGVTL